MKRGAMGKSEKMYAVSTHAFNLSYFEIGGFSSQSDQGVIKFEIRLCCLNPLTDSCKTKRVVIKLRRTSTGFFSENEKVGPI